MNLYVLFVVNFLGVFTGLSIVTYVWIWPWLKAKPKIDQLKIALAPQMFRLMALGLLHPELSPNMPMKFAEPTVLFDLLVSGVAMLCIVSLHQDKTIGYLLAKLTILIGVLHLVISGCFAPVYAFPLHLAAHWYIPVMLGPVMFISLIVSILILNDKAKLK